MQGNNKKRKTDTKNTKAQVAHAHARIIKSVKLCKVFVVFVIFW